jgi:hypothetical protein
VASVGPAPRITLGEGPDQVTLQPEGRPVMILAKDKALRFSPAEYAKPTGRAAIDTGQLEGQGVRFFTEVALSKPKPTLRSEVRRLILGERPEPRAAVTLLGSPEGRHATLVLGAPGTPVALDWNFGVRRGVMLGPASPTGETALALEIDLQGNLRALVGRGADRRQVGEPIALGKDWHSVFGRMPLPQVGCDVGVCTFASIRYEVEREPPPPPVATASVDVASSEPIHSPAASSQSHAHANRREREKPPANKRGSEKREKSEKASHRREGR